MFLTRGRGQHSLAVASQCGVSVVGACVNFDSGGLTHPECLVVAQSQRELISIALRVCLALSLKHKQVCDGHERCLRRGQKRLDNTASVAGAQGLSGSDACT